MVTRKIEGIDICTEHDPIYPMPCPKCTKKIYYCFENGRFYHIDNSTCRKYSKQHRGIYAVGRERVLK